MPEAVTSRRRTTRALRRLCQRFRATRTSLTRCSADGPGPAARTSRSWLNPRRRKGTNCQATWGSLTRAESARSGLSSGTSRPAHRERPFSSARRHCGRRSLSRPGVPGLLPDPGGKLEPAGRFVVAEQRPTSASPRSVTALRLGRSDPSPGTFERTSRPHSSVPSTRGAVEARPPQVVKEGVYGRRPGARCPAAPFHLPSTPR
jgi:hypothetical protein